VGVGKGAVGDVVYGFGRGEGPDVEVARLRLERAELIVLEMVLVVLVRLA